MPSGAHTKLDSQLHVAEVLLLHAPTCNPATRGLLARQQSVLKIRGCCSGCAHAQDASRPVETPQPSPAALQQPATAISKQKLHASGGSSKASSARGQQPVDMRQPPREPACPALLRGQAKGCAAAHLMTQ